MVINLERIKAYRGTFMGREEVSISRSFSFISEGFGLTVNCHHMRPGWIGNGEKGTQFILSLQSVLTSGLGFSFNQIILLGLGYIRWGEKKGEKNPTPILEGP